MSGNSEETDNPAGLRVEPDLPEPRAGAETRHSLHVAENRVEEARTSGEADGTNGDGEACIR